MLWDVNVMLGSKVACAGPLQLTHGLLVGRTVHLSHPLSVPCLGYEEPRVFSMRRVLTDRAFLAEPKTMLWAFMLGGLIAGAFIILFGLLGVFGAAQAITNPSRHAALLKMFMSWGACTV